MRHKKIKTDEERQREAEAWNTWYPGKYRGYSPFNKPAPPVRDSAGRPLGRGGEIDWNRWADEIADGKWTPEGGYRP